MKNYLTILPWVLCLLLLFYIGQCTHRGKDNPVVQYKDSIITLRTTDTLTIKGDPIPYPVPYQVIDTFIISQNADTSVIMAEYIKLRKYILPVSNDTNSKINVFADVQYNRITNWRTEATYYPHTTIINNTRTITTPKRSRLSGGLILTGNAEYFGAAPSLMFTNKKDNSLMLGYDVINKNYSIGAFIKFGRK